jgi:heme A synthase
MPFGQSRLVDIQLTHRLLMYLTAIAVLAMVALSLVQRVRSRAFALAAILLAAQILLGAANVWLGKHAGLILGHLALGTLLWSTVIYAASTLLAVPVPGREGLRGREAAAGTVPA